MYLSDQALTELLLQAAKFMREGITLKDLHELATALTDVQAAAFEQVSGQLPVAADCWWPAV